MASPEFSAPPGTLACALTIYVSYSPAPRQVREWTIQLAPASKLIDALGHCSLFDEFPDLLQTPLMLGVWGKRACQQQLLQDQDRVEVYRPLRVDPKVARRERFGRQGAKTAGLFSAVRPGAKAGY